MTRFTVPPNFIRGLKPRRRRFGEVPGVPIYDDEMPVYDEDDWPELLKTHEPLKHAIPPCRGYEKVDGVYDQNGYGSCAPESGCQALSGLRVLSGQPWVLFNPLGTYHLVNGGTDTGSTLDDVVESLMKVGAFPEKVWPRSKGWRPRPTDEAMEFASNFRLLEVYDVFNERQAISALLSGFFVHYGSDGHAKTYVGLDNLRTGVYINSWGSDWGNLGYGFERFRNIRWHYGCFAYRTASWYDGEIPTMNQEGE